MEKVLHKTLRAVLALVAAVAALATGTITAHADSGPGLVHGYYVSPIHGTALYNLANRGRRCNRNGWGQPRLLHSVRRSVPAHAGMSPETGGIEPFYLGGFQKQDVIFSRKLRN